MSLQSYLYRVYCINFAHYATQVSDTDPTVCPVHGVGNPVDSSQTVILNIQYIDLATDSYVNIDSSLSDNQAIMISASNANGGIDINAGFGGIAVDTTNSISLDGAAASNFTTSNGNLTLEATAGLAIIDGGSGLNIGNGSATTPILVGTTSYAKSITIGNMTGASQTDIRGGTNGINIDASGAISLDSNGGSSNFSHNTTGNGQNLYIALNGSTTSQLILSSQGTGSDALALQATNGIRSDSSTFYVATGSNSAGAITLDSAFNGGGIVLSSGSQGIAINANGNFIGIGHWSGGDILFGTAAVARNITFGNSTGATRVFNRFGTGGSIKHQDAEVSLSDADATLTISDILTGIFSITPTVNRTLTLPTAANIVSGIPGCEVNDSVDISIINQSTPSDEAAVLIATGTGGTLVGNNRIAPSQNGIASYFTAASGLYRIRLTNVTPSAETYKVYRIS